jgi:D-arabinose 1-dehydrogenase-like Zn-dependent alcohol dehydrogenase
MKERLQHMLSFDVVGHGEPLVARKREMPQPVGRQVILRVTHCGLCHSDIHLWKGYFDLGGGKKANLSDRGITPPLTLGHEPFGFVSAVGPEAKNTKVGQKRLVYPWLGCGACWACQADQPTLCIKPEAIGVIRPGGFATHLLVPDEKYLVETDGIDDASAATLACSGVTSYSAINKLLPAIYEGDWVAIVGCGGVGLLAISILWAMGQTKILACDVDDAKLDAATKLGAAKTLRVDRDDAARLLAEQTAGRLGGVVDFVGRPETFNLSYSTIRKGGRYVLVGLYGGNVELAIPPIAQRAISIIGSFVGSLEDLIAVVTLAKQGKLGRPPVTVEPAFEINAAVSELDRGQRVGRTVLDFACVEVSA